MSAESNLCLIHQNDERRVVERSKAMASRSCTQYGRQRLRRCLGTGVSEPEPRQTQPIPSHFRPSGLRQDTHRIPPATPQFELLGANFTHWQSPPSQGSPSSGVRLLRQNSPVHEGALQSPFLSSDYGNTRLRATI